MELLVCAAFFILLGMSPESCNLFGVVSSPRFLLQVRRATSDSVPLNTLGVSSMSSFTDPRHFLI